MWHKPYSYCKAVYLQWSLEPNATNVNCNNSESSLIFALPTKNLYPTRAAAISDCQKSCLVLSKHCDTIIFDKTTEVCYAYDWCSTITDVSNNVKAYYVPATFPEWMGAVCGFSFGTLSSEALNERGIPYPDCFNTFLWEYLTDPQGGSTSLSNFQLQDKSVLYSTLRYLELNLTTTSNSLAVRHIKNDMTGVDLIVKLRNFVDEHFIANELWVVLHGTLFDLDTQYIHVTRYFVENLLYLIIAVMVAGLLFLIHPLAACVVLLIEVAMVIEVYGFVDWADLHMNGVLTLNMLVSVGLTMEFAAHIARAFMMASAKPGEKIGIPNALPGQIRMKKALREMFTPVTLTAITTFIGIAPIASASFPYFRDYYFVLYVMMILTGWVNGAIFQPVILSFLNPGTFSHENDRRSTAHLSTSPTSQQTQPQVTLTNNQEPVNTQEPTA
jgi:hypothetical protein